MSSSPNVTRSWPWIPVPFFFPCFRYSSHGTVHSHQYRYSLSLFFYIPSLMVRYSMFNKDIQTWTRTLYDRICVSHCRRKGERIPQIRILRLSPFSHTTPTCLSPQGTDFIIAKPSVMRERSPIFAKKMGVPFFIIPEEVDDLNRVSQPPARQYSSVSSFRKYACKVMSQL